MAFRLDLKLEDMKRQIGWDDANFYNVPSVSWHEYPLVSYDNNGKDYLALFR